MRVSYVDVVKICESSLGYRYGQRLDRYTLVKILVSVYGLIDVETLGLVDRAFGDNFCD